MEKYLDVMRRTVELSETGLEGLEHMKQQIEEGYFEQSLPLFTDVISAYLEIEKSLSLFSDELSPNQLAATGQQLSASIETVVAAFEKGGGRESIYDLLNSRVIPQYRVWQEELQRCLQPYFIS